MEKLYTKQFIKQIADLYETNALFREVTGEIQVDGIRHNQTAFTVKVSPNKSILKPYDPTKGLSKGDTIVATDKDVPFEKAQELTSRVQDLTVNDAPEEVIAAQLASDANALTEYANELIAKELCAKASDKNVTGDLAVVFNKALAHFTNKKVNKAAKKYAYVTAPVYSALLDDPSTTAAKKSQTDIDRGEVYTHKGFEIVLVPEGYFPANKNILIATEGSAVLAAGVVKSRAVDEVDDFATAIQSVVKYAIYVPDERVDGVILGNVTPKGATTTTA